MKDQSVKLIGDDGAEFITLPNGTYYMSNDGMVVSIDRIKREDLDRAERALIREYQIAQLYAPRPSYLAIPLILGLCVGLSVFFLLTALWG